MNITDPATIPIVINRIRSKQPRTVVIRVNGETNPHISHFSCCNAVYRRQGRANRRNATLQYVDTASAAFHRFAQPWQHSPAFRDEKV